MPSLEPAGTFNHRTAAILMVVIGLVGCFIESVESTGPLRIGLFAALLITGTAYSIRLIRARRRLRA